MSRAVLLSGDVLTVLRGLEAGSVRCCVTSPPYWGLRSYGTAPQVWGGDPAHRHRFATRVDKSRAQKGNGGSTLESDQRQRAGSRFVAVSGACSCGAWRGELGLEPTPELYVDHLVEVFREVRRVLAEDGTLWLNLGDSYASDGGSERQGVSGQMAERGVVAARSGARQKKRPVLSAGLKPKDLVGVPWLAAFALRADGWYLRQEIIWHKNNPMPESVRDRPTRAHEQLFLLSRSPRYHYDAEAIAEPLAEASLERIAQPTFDTQRGGPKDERGNRSQRKGVENLRAKVARAGNKQRDYPAADDGRGIPDTHKARGVPWIDSGVGRNARTVWTIPTTPYRGAHFATFPEELARRCVLAGSAAGDAVLDPFGGSGTVAVVATGHGRRAVYVDLNPEYLELARQRIGPFLCD